MKRKNLELKLIFAGITVLFTVFLLVPAARLFLKSVWDGAGFTGEFYTAVFSQRGFGRALRNSFAVSAAAAVLSVLIAFLIAYAVHYTNLPRWLKRGLQVAATFPMFLPTITYGFAIIYSFGKQGLITQLLGRQIFNIYGFWGLMTGYVIYTIPTAFLLLHNTMGYIDKKTLVVSKAMGDSHVSTFWIAVLRPLLGTLAGAFIQSFFLCFTDFGIPASVGGKYEVVATVLYNQMLGGIPDFHRGAVVAVVMLLPSVGSIFLMQFLERYNIRYNRSSDAGLRKNRARDAGWGAAGMLACAAMLSIFAVVFVVPMVEDWPYKTAFSSTHFRAVFADGELLAVYWHSIVMALLTALFGTLLAYGAALVTARSTLPDGCKKVMESIALVTNTIPGMVLGLAFLFSFSGTPLQNTLGLMILCNIVHYFSTPYLMMKNSLSKMNAGWETTAMLMGDSWIKTILRVVTPNALSSLIEVFSYYFINSMVTISALIFISGARTMVLTTKIKQLQYINKFNEVFVLSLLILATNLAAKYIFSRLANRNSKKQSNVRKESII
ncbi:ABC transporter permease subunit [Agathobaculum sp.]|uniref:ABC transporter permease subunit n=1 Tax=Agathobaculum sp. TaxID=2048138 RepID=UPI002A82D968|nr:ABC transporter permease subunit [Agathobaculum sp.]MDY3619465.1 ABC transporter permease subunit [Agathobaculum sp.]